MQKEEQALHLTHLATMMASLVAHFMVKREMPEEFLEKLNNTITSYLQEVDMGRGKTSEDTVLEEVQ